jgi:iron complex outermembrane receptor protein
MGILLLGAAALSVATVRPASGQDTSSPSSGGEPQLQEVIVSAQKRPENNLNVPIAVKALSSSDLAARGLDGIHDLQQAVPALQFNSVGGDPNIFLRGVGTDTDLPNADPSVAPYVDGVYVAFSKGLDFDLAGLDHIEVLEGPQGTLFGRNSSGGAINFITRTPTDAFKYSASATAGNFSLSKFNGYVEGKAADGLDLGVYASFSGRNTYDNFIFTTPAAAGLTPGRVTQKDFRVKGVYETGLVKLTGSYEYFSAITPEINYRNTSPDAPGFAIDPPALIRPYLFVTDFGSTSRTFVNAGTLREEVALGWASLVGISGVRNTNNFGALDDDATGAPLIGLEAAAHETQYSQELQLLSPSGQRLTWIAGLYYYHDSGGFVPLNIVFGPTIAPPIAVDTETTNVKTNSYSAFAQATYEIIDRLNLTLGARYTQDHKAFTSSEGFYDSSQTLLFPSVEYPKSQKTWNNFTPKVGLDYKIGSTLLYGSYSEGYKAGVYNIASLTAPGPVNPEHVHAFEIGTKSQLLDHRLNLTTSVYHYSIDDLQVQTIPPSGGTAILQNAASAKIYGAEIAIDALVTDNLRLNASTAYIHSRYNSFPGYSTFIPGTLTPTVVDASGNVGERTPTNTSSVGATYTHGVWNGTRVELSGNVYYNSGFYWEPANHLKQGSYMLLNASAAYVFADDRARVTFWGKNLADKYLPNVQFPSVYGVSYEDGTPRTFGVTFSISN